jgi:magnesium-transporting ATPase (P-type)
MITGDKLETDIEIAKSCRIIEDTTLVLRFTLSSINQYSPKEVRELIKLRAKEFRKHFKKGKKSKDTDYE